jgi:23S rRNA (guanosine2251-2'-O)-methyltransferase
MPTQKEIIFGIRAVSEAIKSGQEFDRVLFRKGLQGVQATELLSLARKSGILVQFVPPEKLNRITRRNHQGVVALISPVAYHNLEQLVPGLFEAGKTPLILVLDGITDVRNFGAIARSAECAGVHALVIPQAGSAGIQEDAIKTSAGALMTLPVCRVPRLAETLQFLKNSGIRIIGSAESASESLFGADLKDPVAIVVGSEEKGIHPSVLALCDQVVAIPVHGQIASLNVSVAASLMVYEAVRQREG